MQAVCLRVRQLAAATALVVATGWTLPDATAASGADVDPNGVLKVASNLDQFDVEVGAVHAFGNIGHLGIVYHVFGAPLRLAADGVSYEPYLAESFEIVDGSTVTLRLRDGLTFQDGAPYDAQTLADGMLEYQAMDTVAFDAYPLDEVAEIDVVSETELTFHLSEPLAGLFLDALANAPAIIQSPDSTREEPIGAGPYRIVEYVQDDRVVAERWEDFVDAGEYLLAGVEWLHIPQIEAAQNALRSGQVDLIATTPSDLDSLLESGPFASVVTNSRSHIMIAACKAVPPFDDARFREAFDLAIDRDKANEVAFGGLARPLTGVGDIGDDQPIGTGGDPERSRELLGELGWDSSTPVVLGMYPGAQMEAQVAESVVADLAEVGVELELTIMEGFLYSDYVNTDVGGALVLGNVFPGPQAAKVPGALPESHWNPCGDEDAALNDLLAPLLDGSSRPAEQDDEWVAVHEHVVSNNLWFPIVSWPATYVYDAERVQGLREGAVSLSASNRPSPHLDGVSIIAG